ncbi:hypothetical protein WA158_004583 [Blastocystis sp. Blastoise]
MRIIILHLFFLLLVHFCYSDCLNGQIELKIRRVFASTPLQESWKIYENSVVDLNLIYEGQGSESDGQNSQRTEATCVSLDTTYILVLIDTNGDGWGGFSGNKALISLEVDGFEILSTTLPFETGNSKGRLTQKFMITLPILPTSAIKYTNGAQTTSDWTIPSFDDSGWLTGTPGQIPDVTQITRYYRTSATITDLDLYYVLYLGIYTSQGIVVYVNGIEILRYYMTSDTITATTQALTTDEDSNYRKISIPVRAIRSTTSPNQVVIAVEIHGKASESNRWDDTHILLYKPLYSESDIFNVGGDTLCSPTTTKCQESIDTVSSNQVINNNLDGDPFTLTVSMPQFRFTFLNRYSIISSGNPELMDPYEWTLYGSNDGTHWIFLDFVTDVIFSQRKTVYNYDLKSNKKPYSKYKWVVSKTNNDLDSISYSGINFYSYDQELLSSGLHYSKTYFSYIQRDHIELSPTSNGFITFSCTDIPTGLSITSTTGKIVGSLIDNGNYTLSVSATDALSMTVFQTTLTISISDCSQPDMSRLLISPVVAKVSSVVFSLYNIENDSLYYTFNEEDYNIDGDYYMCIPAALYKMNIQIERNLAITDHYFFTVNLLNTNNVQFQLLIVPAFATRQYNYTINTQMKLFSGMTWKTSYDIPAINSNTWMQNTYDISDWTDYSSYTSSVVSNHIQLYRNTFTLTSISNIQGISCSVNIRYGAIIYINEERLHTYNYADTEPLTIESIPSRSETSYFYHSFTAPIDCLNANGINTISIAIISSTSTPVAQQTFDCLFVLLASSSEMTRIFDASSGANRNHLGYPPSNLFDYDFNTYWSAEYITGSSKAIIYIYIKNQRYEYINKYCLVSSVIPEKNDPLGWNVLGSQGIYTNPLENQYQETSTKNLGFRNSIYWEERGQRRCFYITNNPDQYNRYTFEFLGIRNEDSETSIALSQIELYLEDLSHINYPSFAFTRTNIQAIKSLVFPTIYCTSPYYQNFTITPRLPTTLSMDSSNGYITGIPLTTQERVTYTVYAYRLNGSIASTYISITISDYGETSEQGWSFENALTHDIVANRNGGLAETVETFYYCIPRALYTMTLRHTSTSGWGNGYFRVIGQSNMVLYTGTLPRGLTTQSFSVNLHYLFIPTLDSWTFALDVRNIDSDWIQPSYNKQEGWQNGSLPDRINSLTQFYRTKFAVAINDPQFAGLEFMVIAVAGMVVYVNGHMVYHVRMPADESWTITTQATNALSSAVQHYITVSIEENELTATGNVFAVEIHQTDVGEEGNCFNGHIRYVYDWEYRVINGVASSDILVEGDYGIDKLFDNNYITKTVSGSRCARAQYKWWYSDNRVDFVTGYKLTNGDNCNQNHPSGWRVEASNDNTHWDILHRVHNVTWDSYTQTKQYSIVTNKSYKMYQLYILECKNDPLPDSQMESCDPGIQLSEFELFSHRVEASCDQLDSFVAVINNTYSYSDCNHCYQGYRRRFCLNGVFQDIETFCTLAEPSILTYPLTDNVIYINMPNEIGPPSTDACEMTYNITEGLPTGFSLDYSTGKISGTSEYPFPRTSFTVCGTNIKGSICTTITIQLKEGICAAEPGWPSIKNGGTYSIACENPLLYSGSIVRSCTVKNGTVMWTEAQIECYLRTPTISYSPSSYELTYNQRIESIYPIVNGNNITSYTIQPDLLSGLAIDPDTGVISGTPNVYGSTTYTIILNWIGGMVTTTLSLIVYSGSTCLSEDNWLQTKTGYTCHIPCENPLLYSGSMSRSCTGSGTWSSIVNGCVLGKPIIKYERDINAYTGYQIPKLKAFIVAEDGYTVSISPYFNHTLYFNQMTGDISGTTSSLVDQSYTLSVSNSAGSSNAIVHIKLIEPRCPRDGLWESARSGESKYINCDDQVNYSGYKSRYCHFITQPIWNDVVDNCVLNIPTIRFSQTSYKIYKNLNISPITPIVTGLQITRFYLDRDIVTNLIVNATSGTITGSASKDGKYEYKMFVSNPTGSSSATFNLEIVTLKCDVSGTWAATDINSYRYASCPDGLFGSKKRYCLYDGSLATWQDENFDGCYNQQEKGSIGFGQLLISFPIIVVGLKEAQMASPASLEIYRLTLFELVKNYIASNTDLYISSIQTQLSIDNNEIVVYTSMVVPRSYNNEVIDIITSKVTSGELLSILISTGDTRLVSIDDIQLNKDAITTKDLMIYRATRVQIVRKVNVVKFFDGDNNYAFN